MGIFGNSAGRPVKQAGKSTIQQKRANGDSYRKQAAKSMGRSIWNAPKPPPTKKGGW